MILLLGAAMLVFGMAAFISLLVALGSARPGASIVCMGICGTVAMASFVGYLVKSEQADRASDQRSKTECLASGRDWADATRPGLSGYCITSGGGS